MNVKFVALTLVLCLATIGYGGVYDWTGAIDGDWGNSGNWVVTGSTWVHPNEEFGNEYTNQDCDEILLTNGDTVSKIGGLSPDGARDGSNTANLTLDNGGVLNIDGTIWIADHGNTKGTINVLNGSALNVAGQLKAGDDAGSVGTLNVSNSSVVIGSNLVITNRAGGTGYLNISGSSTIDVGGKFYMNDGGGSGSRSYVMMDGGTITTAGNSYFNDDASVDSEAYFTLNAGTFNSGGVIDISWNLDGLSHLTINGGEMTAAAEIRLGVGGGGDTGESRIFLNGGVLQGEDLLWNMTDSKIVFVDGELRINGVAVSVGDMQALVDTGKIDVSGAAGYAILTDGDYTVLIPEPATLVLLGLGGLGLIRRRRR